MVPKQDETSLEAIRNGLIVLWPHIYWSGTENVEYNNTDVNKQDLCSSTDLGI